MVFKETVDHCSIIYWGWIPSLCNDCIWNNVAAQSSSWASVSSQDASNVTMWQLRSHPFELQSSSSLSHGTYPDKHSFCSRSCSQGPNLGSSCSHNDQLADLLTKPLPRQRKDFVHAKIGLLDGSSIFWGCVKHNSRSITAGNQEHE